MDKKIKHGKIYVQFRRVVQVVSFLLLPALFIRIFLSIKVVIMLFLHHQGTFQTAFPNILLLVVATIVTVFGGRFFCGWMCAFGSMGDFFYKIPRLKNKHPHKFLTRADKYLKWIKYLLLGAIAVLIWSIQLISLPTGINPWDLFGMLAVFGEWPSMSIVIQGWAPAASILLLIITGSLFVERFFCRYFCPLGAYFSIVSRLRPFIIMKKRENCGKCTLCTQKCSMGIELNNMEKVTTGECINCMECIVQCPRANAHMEMSGENINVLIAGTVSCALVAGSYSLGNFYETQMMESSSTAISNVVTDNPIENIVVSESVSTNESISADEAILVSESATTNQSENTSQTFEDGTYEGSGTGFRGDTNVTVEVSSGEIVNIMIDSYQDDQEFFNRASTTVIQEILDNQTVNVDAVSGATYSSNGIKEAVANALNIDFTVSAIQNEGHGNKKR